VTHFYSHLSVATARLDAGCKLRLDDVIQVRGHSTRASTMSCLRSRRSDCGPNGMWRGRTRSFCS
jgi:hypothetical protein